MHPATLQLELTYKCNNHCDFCYNRWSIEDDSRMSYERLQKTLVDVRKYGVFSVNFNGGEPLLYEHFFDVAEYAVKLGLDIHCNTNATLITSSVAKKMAQFFPALCASLHGTTASTHDAVVGRTCAFNDTIRGIEHLIKEHIYVAVNITLSQNNMGELLNILRLLASLKVGAVLVSRVLTDNSALAISDNMMCAVIRQVRDYQETTQAFGRIAFPQPFPLCKCADETLREFIGQCNVACSAGILTARITPDGRVTPCPVIETPIIGDCTDELFSSIWNRFEKQNWRKKMPAPSCGVCNDLPCCGGGCLPQNITGILVEKE
jgi:radical SAM protein with 4Fe4S-binding SPASM domain